jgi:hypothetical protein
MSSEVQIAVIDQQDTQIVLAVPGVQGATGSPISAGGTANQVLRKASSTNYDTDWSLVTNAMVDSSAAIAGTKISPNFGSQNVVTTGTSTAASFIPTSSSVPTNGVYLPSANNVAISTNGTGRLFVDASGNVGVGTTPSYPFHVVETSAVTSAASFSTFYGQGTRADLVLRATSSANDQQRQIIRSNSDSLIFGTENAAVTVFTEKMRLDSSGRLGLGTSSASTNLHIGSGSGGNNLGILLSRGATTNFFEAHDGTKSFIAGTDSANGFVKIGSLSNDPVSIVQGNGSAIYIDTSKRVGIGTTDVGSYSTYGNKLVIYGTGTNGPGMTIATGTSDTGSIYFADGTTGNQVARGAVQYAHADDALLFQTAASERFRCDSSGRLLVGTSTARSNFFNSTVSPLIQQEGVSGSSRFASITYGTNTEDDPIFILGKHRGASVGGTTVVNSGDGLGKISFQGSDGTEFVEGAAIRAEVDGTLGANDLPSRLVFSTTADGASSPTERMRIRNTGSSAYFATQSGAGSAVLELNASSGAGTTDYLLWATHSATTVFTGTVALRVYTNGDVQNINNSYGAISDVKFKENIVNAGSQWSDIKALQIRKYNFKEETGHQTHTQIGLIAQEVELVSPGLVNESPDRDAEGNDLGTVTKSVNYSVLYMKAVKALQEAMERIEVLEQRLTDAGIA